MHLALPRRVAIDPSLPKLRVRTARSYPVPFVFDLGQRNAVFLKRPLTPLRRFFDCADAFAPMPELDFDLVHTLNAIPLMTRKPYIMTFEDYLPRVPEDRYIGWLERRLRRMLLSPRCVRIIAMSDYAVRQFRWQNREHPEARAALEAKMEVLRPAVPLRRERPKTMSRDKLRLIIVGADFMRKGGPALLRAHERLRARGVPVETTVVSTLRWSPKDYIGPASAEYVTRELARVRQEGVVHHNGLPNAEAMRLVEEADFFVFPTLHDTFGYAPVEALSCATPVLASNTAAQPEIVDDSVNGWLLPFENDEQVGKWRWIYRNAEPGYLDAYEHAIATMSEVIAERLQAAWESRGGYEAMSAAAIAKVRTSFDRDAARERLEQLYELCR